MLKAIPALFSSHLQAANTSLTLLCRRPMAAMMTIVVIAIALTLPALFWVFSDNIEALTNSWERGGRISLYLKSSLPKGEEAAFLARVQGTEGVGKATLKSPAEGLAELQKQEGMHDIMRYLPANPLPALIEVTPAISLEKSFQVEQLFERLKAYSQVEQAKLDMEWVERLHAILNFISKAAHSLMLLLACAVVLIVGNTMRLAIQNRYEEIQVLKLIGADDSFIARPFLYSGVWYGLAGSVFAILFVNLFMLSIAAVIKQLALAYQMHYPIAGLSVRQAYLIVFLSIFLGWVGASVAVKKQLSEI